MISVGMDGWTVFVSHQCCPFQESHQTSYQLKKLSGWYSGSPIHFILQSHDSRVIQSHDDDDDDEKDGMMILTYIYIYK
jgi:hypothetical protein